jgi:hypothetical protein
MFQSGESASAEASSAQMAADLAFSKLLKRLSGKGLGGWAKDAPASASAWADNHQRS